MHFFCLIALIFISIVLIFLILLQPGKGFNHTSNSQIKNNINIFNNIGTGSFITKIIGIFSCLFLLVSISLCNLNGKTVESDYFWNKNENKTLINKNTHLMKKEQLNTDIPH